MDRGAVADDSLDSPAAIGSPGRRC